MSLRMIVRSWRLKDKRIGEDKRIGDKVAKALPKRFFLNPNGPSLNIKRETR